MASRTCVYCGAKPMTREHVWPDWLRRRLSIDEKLEHSRLLERPGEEPDEMVFHTYPFTMTAKVVCANCNGGWMRLLEERAKALLDGMISGRARELHDGDLATWALMKTMMFDQASPKEARLVFPALYAHLFEHRAPPPESVRVWMSSYKGELVGFTGFTAIEATAEGQSDPGEHNVFVRTFSMGPVLFQVFGTSNPALYDMRVDWSGYGPRPSPPVLQIWPTGPSRTWYPDPALNDQGVIWFTNQIVAGFIHSAERGGP